MTRRFHRDEDDEKKTTASLLLFLQHQPIRKRRTQDSIGHHPQQFCLVSFVLLFGIIIIITTALLLPPLSSASTSSSSENHNFLVFAFTTTTCCSRRLSSSSSASLSLPLSSDNSVTRWRRKNSNSQHQKCNSSSSRLHASENNENDKDNLISEMDARILQSMLRDNKLDLEQNQNMKKLLERGIKKDETDEKLNDLQSNDDEVDDDETPYSSQAIKKLADTKFWQALSRNAADVFESVAIAATNQLEKSAKVLVGLGFFAWERAKQDAARALPTAGTASVPKKKVFQISDASSYVEPTQQDEQEEEEESSMSQRAALRQEFTTPADELSAVTAEIGKIFRQANVEQPKLDKSKDMKNPFFTAFVEQKELAAGKNNAGSGAGVDSMTPTSLSTTATRGTGRLDSAFQRKKSTQLAKEKENVVTKSNRLMGSAIDTVYEVKQEISGETNIPGYKTKQIRDQTVDVSRRIAGAAKGAAGLLSGASSFLLGSGKNKQQQRLPSAGSSSSSSSSKVKAEPVKFLDDTAYFAAASADDKDASSPPIFSIDQLGDQKEEPEYLTAEIVSENDDKNTVVVDVNDSFNFFGSSISQAKVVGRNKKKETKTFGTTNGYLDEIDAASATGGTTIDGAIYVTFDTGSSSNTMMDGSSAVVGEDDDGLRKVTAEVVFDDDDDFNEMIFEQAKNVDNLSVDELLKEAEEAERARERVEPNLATKITLRSLDVVFLVGEKLVSFAPIIVDGTKRAVIRINDGKLKTSTGSNVGWEFHPSNVRGEQRY